MVAMDSVLGANVEAIHGGEGSPNSKKDVARRWMCRLVLLGFYCGGHGFVTPYSLRWSASDKTPFIESVMLLSDLPSENSN